MKVTLPAQSVVVDTPQGIDPLWYEKFQQIVLTINSGIIGQGRLATTTTTGFAFIPSCLGPPTGVPVGVSGFVPLIYDATNNRLYAYNGAWKSAAFT